MADRRANPQPEDGSVKNDDDHPEATSDGPRDPEAQAAVMAALSRLSEHAHHEASAQEHESTSENPEPDDNAQ